MTYLNAMNAINSDPVLSASPLLITMYTVCVVALPHLQFCHCIFCSFVLTQCYPACILHASACIHSVMNLLPLFLVKMCILTVWFSTLYTKETHSLQLTDSWSQMYRFSSVPNKKENLASHVMWDRTFKSASKRSYIFVWAMISKLRSKMNSPGFICIIVDC